MSTRPDNRLSRQLGALERRKKDVLYYSADPAPEDFTEAQIKSKLAKAQAEVQTLLAKIPNQFLPQQVEGE